MERNINKTVVVNKYVRSEELIAKEIISEMHVYPILKNISVTIDLYNQDQEFVKEEQIGIDSKNYELLFSDDIFFGTEKQPSGYQEKDLWKIIDKIRNESVF